MIHIIETEALQKLLQKNEVVLIDVREQSEYNESRIEGSILMPLSTLNIQKIKELSKDGKKIAIHCKSGGRSLRACQMLMDYDNELDVYNVEGGITAWNLRKNVDSNSSNSSGGCSTGGAGTGGCNMK